MGMLTGENSLLLFPVIFQASAQLQWNKGRQVVKHEKKIQPIKTYLDSIKPSETANMHTTRQAIIYLKSNQLT